MEYSVFDIIGPIMIGPSSSHTAGAVRIARVARQIGQEDIVKADFYLHGSFAETLKGHGTDRALVAGLLGYTPDDERIRDSLGRAHELGLDFEFHRQEIAGAHPNTVRIVMTKSNGAQVEVTGSSIGGGNIRVVDIDGIPVDLDFQYPTLILQYTDKKGIIAFVTKSIFEAGFNIVRLSQTLTDENIAVMILEVDDFMEESPVLDELKNDDRFCYFRYLSKKFT